VDGVSDDSCCGGSEGFSNDQMPAGHRIQGKAREEHDTFKVQIA
jgi:hypothetical protein